MTGASETNNSSGVEKGDLEDRYLSFENSPKRSILGGGGG